MKTLPAEQTHELLAQQSKDCEDTVSLSISLVTHH